jgi:prophage regulatory protein
MNNTYPSSRLNRASTTAAKPAERERFLRLPEVINLTALGKTSLYARIKQGQFPAPVPVGTRRVAWLQSEVSAWMQNRVAQRPDAPKTPAA